MQVVHMDVKSKNILLDKEYKVAKIADVGLARVLGNTVSTRGLPLGTFHYAAPELLVGDRNLVTEKVHCFVTSAAAQACLPVCLSVCLSGFLGFCLSVSLSARVEPLLAGSCAAQPY